MASLSLTNAACNYLVASFEAALAPKPKDAEEDSKHYKSSDARMCNEMLMPFDCALVEYRRQMEEATKRIGKLNADSIRPDLTPDVLQAMNAKFSQMLSSELEDLAQGPGVKATTVELNGTLFKWLKEEWPAVNRPSNYKQRAIAAQVTAALDAAKKE